MPEQTYLNVQHELRVSLLHAASWLNNEIRKFLQPYDITQKQFNILRILRGAHPKSLSIQTVRGRMIDRMSDASRLIDRLVRKGLIEKYPCPEDGRSNRALITDAGLELLAKIDADLKRLDRVMDHLDDTDQQALVRLLKLLCGEEAEGPQKLMY